MHILVVDDDATLRTTLRLMLEGQSHHVSEAVDGQEAVDLVAKGQQFDAVLLDVNMPRMNGIDALRRIKEMHPETFCMMLSAFSDVKDAVIAIKNGAYDYLEKPVDAEKIFTMLSEAEQAQNIVRNVAMSAPQLEFAEGRKIVGGSSSLAKVFDIVYKLSKVETSVLIRGESGTGKELVARAIHLNSHRKKGPFVAINCAAIPENLIESELFGHERGAFTGADRRKMGKFQFADGGTLFLDEIGDISLQMQVKLLRVLQEKVYTPVGSNQEQTADVRVVAATNRPLEQMISNGTFRADLFYRLNVLPIMLPPLRNRADDIAQLIQAMIEKFNKLHQKKIKGISSDALQTLQAYSWPGNIRELENVIEHAFIVGTHDYLQLEAMPDHVLAQVQSQSLPSSGNTSSYDTRDDLVSANPISAGIIEQKLQDLQKIGITRVANLGSEEKNNADLDYPTLKEQFEREFIIRALKAFDGRINQTAEHTKMTKVTLLRKLEKYGINPKEYYPTRNR